MYHLEERFERELGAANREIRHLRVRLSPYLNPHPMMTRCLLTPFHLKPGNRGSREASSGPADPPCSARRYPAVCCGVGGYQNRVASFKLSSLARNGQPPRTASQINAPLEPFTHLKLASSHSL